MTESDWQPGSQVRVKQGVLAGIEGTVAARRDGRLLVHLESLQKGVSIEISDDLLERLRS